MHRAGSAVKHTPMMIPSSASARVEV